MSSVDMSVETLKKSLAANGLATYGTKEQMLQRLLSGDSEKKKPGPKAKGDVPKKKKSTSVKSEPIDGEEAAFIAKDRPRLAAHIADFDEQTAELKRQWAYIKDSRDKKAKTAAAPAAPAAAAAPGLIKLPAALDAAQMSAMKLKFESNEIQPMTGAILHVYSSTAGAPVKPATGKKRKGAVAAMPCDKEEDEEDEDEDDDMSWACEVASMRLVKKCRKETLVMLCNDFGIGTSGNKEKLADDIGEQLHYETDDEDEDDENDE